MKILNYITILFLLCLFACKKDHGNYDYTRIPDFTLDTTSFKGSYQVEQGREILVIDPKLIASDTSDYRFLWRLFQTTAIPTFTRYDTLGKQRRLQTLINSEPGTTNTLEFQVTQKSTGLRKYFSIGISTISNVPSGYMIVYDKNGDTDMDILRYVSLLSGTKDTVYRNALFGGLGGKLLPGTPVSVLGNQYGVYLATSKSGVVWLENNSLNLLADQKQMFVANTPSVMNPQALGQGSFLTTTMLYVNDGLVNWSNTRVFVGPVVLPSGEKYYAAPFVVPQSPNQCMFYDNLSRRFLSFPQNSGIIASYANAASTAKFNLNNIGKDIVWMGAGYLNYNYAYFKDVNSTNNKRYVYIINAALAATNPGIGLLDVSALPDILNAKFYEASLISPNLFYATTNKVYSYAFNESTSTYSTVLNPFTAPAGEEITAMNLQVTGVSTTTSRKMCIATWNESTRQSKVYIYEVTPLTGVFSANPVATSTHEGKILLMGRKSN